MKSVTLNGFGLDLDAMALRFEAECQSRGITTRAQFIAAWTAATAVQRTQLLGRVLFGAVVLPDDDQTQAAPYIATRSTV